MIQPVVEKMNGVIDGVLAPAPALLACAEVALVRVQVFDGVLGEPPFFISGELKLEGIDDHTGETFLNREDILDGAVVSAGQECVHRTVARRRSRT
jgi:hypothetical protein